jgi:hypothetical protein
MFQYAQLLELFGLFQRRWAHVGELKKEASAKCINADMFKK